VTFRKLYNTSSKRMEIGHHLVGNELAFEYVKTPHTGCGEGTKIPCYNSALQKNGCELLEKNGTDQLLTAGVV